MGTFADLFTYRGYKVTQQPSHATIRFEQLQLLRDVTIKLGNRTPAIIPSGSAVEAAIWVQPGVLQLKCGFAGEAPLAQMPDSYQQILKDLVTASVANGTAVSSAPKPVYTKA